MTQATRTSLMTWIAVAAVAVTAAFLPLAVPARVNSPDEASNRHFASLFAERGVLWFYEPLNFIVGGAVRPRSMSYVGDFVVPGGFIGLPVIWGVLERVISESGGAFVAPALSALAALAFGSIISRLRGRRAGAIAAVLFSAQPVWWYWSGRTFMPNVPFLCFLLFAAWFAVTRPLSRVLPLREWLVEFVDLLCSGGMLAFALAVRPVEAPWIFAVLALLLIRRSKDITLLHLVSVALGAIAVAVPFLLLQHTAYGTLFASGYGDGLAAAPPLGLAGKLLGPMAPIVFPLGFAPRMALAKFVTVGIGFHWWWTAAVTLSVAWLAASKKENGADAKDFALCAALAAAWLIPFYGSYVPPDIHDLPASVGMSHLRYWLPLFAASVVPVALALDGMAAAQKHGAAKAWGAAALLMSFAFASVFFSPHEGFLSIAASLERDSAILNAVVSKTEQGAVIITDQDDKFLFPSRRVIVPLRSAASLDAVAKLRGKASLYYLGITFPKSDLDYLRTTMLGPRGFSAEPVEAFGEQTLYRLAPI